MFDARAWKISRPFYVDGQIARMPRFPRDLENERRSAATFQSIPLLSDRLILVLIWLKYDNLIPPHSAKLADITPHYFVGKPL